MEELNSTVKLNAENSEQASQEASSASNTAKQGGEAVNQVVATMNDLNKSSQEIAGIISTIDAIAFQTNILALNASVEAARAGEHGRGFAVVAEEVRRLAQRSAEAAREINTLISSNLERVNHGNERAEEASKSTEQIVAAIERVTSIMKEISHASAEQSTGVQEVGRAVTEMDQVTQQNASLVHESATAANNLRKTLALCCIPWKSSNCRTLSQKHSHRMPHCHLHVVILPTRRLCPPQHVSRQHRSGKVLN